MISEDSWGHLKPFENYAAPDKPADFKRVTFEESFRSDLREYHHAGHAMFFARDCPEKLFDLYTRRAAVLMQVRFDGYIGFPGGLIDPEDRDVVAGLNRELLEEAGLQDKNLQVTQENHFCTDVNHKKKLILHFFLKEVSLCDFEAMEKNILNAKDYGFETLGIVRVPCYVLPDSERGLPIFLCNRFIGQAKTELIECLVRVGIFTKDEMDRILSASENFAKRTKPSSDFD